MKRPVFAANWKMNHGPSDARAFLRTFLDYYPRGRERDRTVMFFPPALTLTTVVETLRDRTDILVGVQNIYHEDKGAFTGESSAPIARDAGARLVLVGHSERRHLFGETDEETAKKCAAAVRAGLTPMLCVGEKLDERERGETESVVLRQLRAGLASLETDKIATALIAYEPVWAIGTGKTATPDDAATVHKVIRGALRELAGERGIAIPILYGGSVNRSNAPTLLAAPNVDGLLVGGASLDAEGWASIVRS
ncbi:MAG TPA: triose-phosphate isomerase [Gemmatimonadaceae bacterium]|nr:triose-phosphate isomerase [Gemmatimonadaceae bacterium]